VYDLVAIEQLNNYPECTFEMVKLALATYDFVLEKDSSNKSILIGLKYVLYSLVGAVSNKNFITSRNTDSYINLQTSKGKRFKMFNSLVISQTRDEVLFFKNVTQDELHKKLLAIKNELMFNYK
jgi:hypothetical protein